MAEEKLINDIYIDKEEIMVGEKITLTVDSTKILLCIDIGYVKRGIGYL